MADATVGVAQSASPDRLIANQTRLNAASTVYQQEIVIGPQRVLLDYDSRTDGNPVYVGKNNQQAVVGDTTWVVLKLFYDASNRLVDTQVLWGAWTGRAALSWRASGAD